MSKFLPFCLVACGFVLQGVQAGEPKHAQPEPPHQQARPVENRAAVENQAHAAEEFARQQEAARRAQEQGVRAQEDQARRAQQEFAKAQQQARKAQEDVARQQANAVNHQEEQARVEQTEALKAQETNKLRQEAAVKQTPQNFHEAEHVAHANIEQIPVESPLGKFSAAPRRAQPPSLSVKAVPIEKALSMPVLQENVTPEEREHAQAVLQNLQTHLVPVAANQAPANLAAIRSGAVERYMGNYNTVVGNQPVFINRQNTFVNVVPEYEYPAWWNSGRSDGWRFSNGFVLGQMINVGLDWLRWGWHPYYGPPPEGFVSAVDYVPTQWIYVPAYGLWRQAGIPGWSNYGPPLSYTGPITVEVLEPKHVQVTDPYTGFEHTTVINVPYFYNAFYHSDAERWGFMNRHDYFVWLNL
jgi:hypothetical protein